MSTDFFEKPILNLADACLTRHWELDEAGQPTQRILETRRRAESIATIPKPKRRKPGEAQGTVVFDEDKGLSINICETIGQQLPAQ
jgi:type III restriction enzyme